MINGSIARPKTVRIFDSYKSEPIVAAATTKDFCSPRWVGHIAQLDLESVSLTSE
jgi:hypothetical protein